MANRIKSSKKPFVVFFDGSEALTEHQCKKIFNVVQLAQLDKNDFCLVTGSINAENDFDTIKLSLNLPYNFILLTTNIYADVVKAGKAKPKFEIKKKPKIFNCLNKNHRAHRAMLLADLITNNLLDRSITSFYGGWQDDFTWFENLCQTVEIKYPEYASRLRDNKNLFPMHVNASSTQKSNPIWVDKDDEFIYNDTYFSLVTETLYFSDRFDFQSRSYVPGIFITEKTYKPVIMKHPFIILSVPGFLKNLRSLGLKTFEPYIDESYDLEEDDEKRIKLIVQETKRLYNFSDSEWINWLSNVEPIIEHNYNWIMNNPKLGLTDVSHIIERLKNGFHS